MEAGCVFCMVVSGDIPGERVHEDERTLAVTDINPFTRGHAVVFPRAHVRGLYEVDEEVMARTFSVARLVATMARDRLGADGVNLLSNTERAAWQSIFHFHVHVIPRYEGDPLKLPIQPRRAKPEELAEVAQQLRTG
jgi:histidine triad (HIT) family protein